MNVHDIELNKKIHLGFNSKVPVEVRVYKNKELVCKIRRFIHGDMIRYKHRKYFVMRDPFNHKLFINI